MRNAIGSCIGRGPTHLDHPRCTPSIITSRGDVLGLLLKRGSQNARAGGSNSGPAGWKARKKNGAGVMFRHNILFDRR